MLVAAEVSEASPQLNDEHQVSYQTIRTPVAPASPTSTMCHTMAVHRPDSEQAPTNDKQQ